MYEIERLVTVIKPKQAFLDWLKQVPDQDDELSLDDLRSDCTALLLPPFESPDEAEDYVKKHIDDIFANELESWCESEEQWPTERTFAKFTDMFDIEYHSMVFDMMDEDFDEEQDLDDDDEDEDDFFEDDSEEHHDDKAHH